MTCGVFEPLYPQSDNGYMPASELTKIQGDLQLQHNVAAAWNTEIAAAEAAGVTLKISDPGGAYRDYALQVDMIKNPSNYGVTAALAPAGCSTHGYGTCVDIGVGNSWAQSHFDSGAWVQDRLKYQGEGNHWHYIGTLTLATAAPSAPQEEDDYMIIYAAISASSDGLIPNGYRYIQNADGPIRALSNLEYNCWADSYPNRIEMPFQGDDLRQLIKVVGLRQQGAPQGLSSSQGPIANDGRLTGTIVY